MIDGSHKLKFSYTLDGVPTAYVWKAVVLYERQITSDPISASVKLTFLENDLRKDTKKRHKKKNFFFIFLFIFFNFNFFTLKALVHA